MRRLLIAILILSAAVAIAKPRYVLLGANETMTSVDKATCKAKIKAVVNDPINITWASLPRYRLISNTNKIFRVLCIDVTRPGSPHPGYSITLAQFETWRAANLDEPAKLQLIATNDPTQALIDAGMEKVP